MASLSLVDGKWVLAADTVAWIDADLSEFTRSDTNGIYDAGSSTLGVTSTIALDGSVHGRIGSGVPDGLFFTLQLTDFDRTKHYAVAIRATWGNTLTGTWEMYLGMGNDSTPVSDGGVYLSTQLDSSAAVGGNDYGTLPSNNQVVTDARYLGGVINYRSDRQDGSVGQNADANRLARGGQNRSVDPGTPMTDNDQYLMVGFGNQNTTDTQTLTNLKVQYQLLTHYGLDT
jgi:hypothetical protein